MRICRYICVYVEKTTDVEFADVKFLIVKLVKIGIVEHYLHAFVFMHQKTHIHAPARALTHTHKHTNTQAHTHTHDMTKLEGQSPEPLLGDVGHRDTKVACTEEFPPDTTTCRDLETKAPAGATRAPAQDTFSP
jgi:hypothetical protein